MSSVSSLSQTSSTFTNHASQSFCMFVFAKNSFSVGAFFAYASQASRSRGFPRDLAQYPSIVTQYFENLSLTALRALESYAAIVIRFFWGADQGASDANIAATRRALDHIIIQHAAAVHPDIEEDFGQGQDCEEESSVLVLMSIFGQTASQK
jgi:hypothetical protein